MLKFGCLFLSLFFFVEVPSVAHANTRIVGGSDSADGYWPWMVSLQEGGSHFCGGSLISDLWVLTSAQCVISKKSKDLTAYLGKLTLEGSNPYETSKDILNIHVHPNYNSQTKDNDIALLRLKKNVIFTDYIHPVYLTSKDSVLIENDLCYIIGWGNTGLNVPLPSPGVLKYTGGYILSNSNCAAYLIGVTDNMICAGYAPGGFGVCTKDEGGPMMFPMDGAWVQAGIVSWYQTCAAQNSPTVYTRVSNYQDWIIKITGKHKPDFITYPPAV